MLNGRLQRARSGRLPVQRQSRCAERPLARQRAVPGQPDSRIAAESGRAEDRATTICRSAPPTSAARSLTAFPSTGDEDQYIGRIDYVQNAKHTLYGRYFLDAIPESADLRRQESADHHAGRQPRAGAIGDHRRQLHVRPGNAELVPRDVQPAARQPRTDGHSDQSDVARA